MRLPLRQNRHKTGGADLSRIGRLCRSEIRKEVGMADYLEVARRTLAAMAAEQGMSDTPEASSGPQEPNPPVTKWPLGEVAADVEQRCSVPQASLSEIWIDWCQWKATWLNRLFQEQGLTKQPGGITAAAVRHGEAHFRHAKESRPRLRSDSFCERMPSPLSLKSIRKSG